MPDTSNRLSVLLDAIEEPSLIVSHGRIDAANRAARDLLGETIAGRDLRLAIRHPLALETIEAGAATDVGVDGIGGTDRRWRLSVRPLDDAATLIRLHDESMVQSTERMRTDFVANASHELRTPLATIIGYAETLGEPGKLDDGLRARFGATIDTEARRMLRIVEDLMSLSRIEADRFHLPDEQVDMAAVARLALDHGEGMAERNACRIDADIEADLPTIRGDHAQLVQLFDNLIGNALRYGCNTRSSRVSVSVAKDQTRLRLVVGDQGDGIAPEHLPRLTERFYRVDPGRSRDSGGTGLGLAIVKHIVERHRGTLDVRSMLGQGTEVIVSLPLS